MQVRKLGFVGLLLAALFALMLQNSATSNAAPPSAPPTPVPPNPGAPRPYAGQPIAASSFTGDVRRLPQAKAPTTNREAPRVRRVGANAPSNNSSHDAVRQAQMGTRQSPASIQNFAGLSFDGWYPPDPNGDVGPNNYVQAVNVKIGIYSKTGTPQATFLFGDLFSGNGGTGTPCDSNFFNSGDPIVLYDATADRWLVSDFAIPSSGPYYECIAYSKTGDPVSGGWNLYPVSTGTVFPDYPKFGVWPDGIYMTANMFGISSEAPRAWAFNRSDMANGLSLRNQIADLPTGYGTLLPGNLRGGTQPPAGEPAFFASIDQPNTFHLWKFHVDWNNPGNSTFTGPTDLTVADFVMPCLAAKIPNCVPQPDVPSSNYLDSLSDRLMMQLQYRNLNGTESLWANHTVAATSDGTTPTGVRWYEIRNPNGTPTVYQQGTFQPDSKYRWMGSLAVDQFGNMALGYSISSAATYPSIAYTGRLVTDSLGILPQAESTLMAGTGSQFTSCGSNPCTRWGDYSAMTIDPTDDCTFWYTNEYYSTTGGSWLTRIGSFKFASPITPPPPPVGPHIYYLPQISRAAMNGFVSCF